MPPPMIQCGPLMLYMEPESITWAHYPDLSKHLLMPIINNNLKKQMLQNFGHAKFSYSSTESLKYYILTQLSNSKRSQLWKIQWKVWVFFPVICNRNVSLNKHLKMGLPLNSSYTSWTVITCTELSLKAGGGESFCLLLQIGCSSVCRIINSNLINTVVCKACPTYKSA